MHAVRLLRACVPVAVERALRVPRASPALHAERPARCGIGREFAPAASFYFFAAIFPAAVALRLWPRRRRLLRSDLRRHSRGRTVLERSCLRNRDRRRNRAFCLTAFAVSQRRYDAATAFSSSFRASTKRAAGRRGFVEFVAATPDIALLFVDDGSTDGTARCCRPVLADEPYHRAASAAARRKSRGRATELLGAQSSETRVPRLLGR